MFLPANTTSILQPLDCSIIANIKQKYKQKIVTLLAQNLENDDDAVTIRDLSLLDGIKMLGTS